jgi:tRNA (Thr-GGU) A37 N-methylase
MSVFTYGIFATRAPARPNPIGISIVRLVRVEGKKLYIRDVDIVDGTPLLDIKPYVPEFDIVPDFDMPVKIGWLEKNVNRLYEAKDDGRFVTLR